ncbi:hypothetical protein BT96DRAFT_1051144, partial [Gymnopus androsaceus JB14]
SERRLYAMKIQVKIQYKALQRALASARRISESKHRLTPYVFHEVRVPLNSAFLAAKSMEASGTLSNSLEVKFDALMGSLTMMPQVLNDVLDFNRLDSGRMHFIKVARCAAYRAMGEKEDVIQRTLDRIPGLTVKTKLVVSSVLNDTGNGSKGSGSGNNHNHDAEASAQLSASRLAQHDYNHGNDKDETIIVRVEVTDTGCGIEGSELTGQNVLPKHNNGHIITISRASKLFM